MKIHILICRHSFITLFKALGGNLALEQIENPQKEQSPQGNKE